MSRRRNRVERLATLVAAGSLAFGVAACSDDDAPDEVEDEVDEVEGELDEVEEEIQDELD